MTPAYAAAAAFADRSAILGVDLGGRPTLLSVLLKLSALAVGLSIGSATMPDRRHRREAR